MMARAAVTLVVIFILGAESPAAEPAPAGSVREVAYLGRGGPARLRLHILLGGRPADAAWAEATDALFAFCDRNGDGALDAAERAVFAPPRSAREPEVRSAGEPVSPLLQLTFPSKTTRVARDQFAAALKEAGYEAVGLTVLAPPADAEQASAALVGRLDQDGDGKLSRGELKAARERLAPVDVNEDELITAAELLGRAVGASPAARGAATEGSRESTPDVWLLAGDPGAMVKQLLPARGGDRTAALRRADLGADEQAFADLDRNGDGRLDAAELEQWLRQPPDWDLDLEFGPGDERARLSLSGDPAGPARSRVQPGGGLEMFRSLVRFVIEAPGAGAPEARTPEQVRGRLRSLAGEPGVVERKQVADRPDLPTFFDFADRNADGRLDLAEVDAALCVLGRLRGCRVAITIRDQGSGLFELLDRNSDGQLSPRELVEATATLRPFADGGDKVGPGDLPRRLFARVAAGSIPAVFSSAIPAAPAAANARPAPPQVPAWFVPMDRNGDGDVSLREFLGPLEMFRLLDRDGDGLISAEEARDHRRPARN